MKKMLAMLSMCMLASPVLASTISAKTNDDANKQHWLDNVSGSFDLTTNYIFRGISQTANKPAAQGGLTYTFPVGLYFNIWGSNTNFTSLKGKTVTSEFDTIAGWKGNIVKDLSYNFYLERDNYPGAHDASYNELYAIFMYKILQLGVSYTGNYYGSHAMGIYYNGTLSYNVPPHYALNVEGISVAAEMGHYSLARAAGLSYNDYSLTLNKIINDIYTVTAQWVSTNGRTKDSPYDSSQVVGTVTAAF